MRTVCDIDPFHQFYRRTALVHHNSTPSSSAPAPARARHSGDDTSASSPPPLSPSPQLRAIKRHRTRDSSQLTPSPILCLPSLPTGHTLVQLTPITHISLLITPSYQPTTYTHKRWSALASATPRPSAVDALTESPSTRPLAGRPGRRRSPATPRRRGSRPPSLLTSRTRTTRAASSRASPILGHPCRATIRSPTLAASPVNRESIHHQSEST